VSGDGITAVDMSEDDAARGKLAGLMQDVVQPLWQWQTHRGQPGRGVATIVAEER